MKATKGQAITCPKCNRPVGEFAEDVMDSANITQDAIAMSTRAVPDTVTLSWHCAACEAPVACGGTSWRLHTAGGWVS